MKFHRPVPARVPVNTPPYIIISGDGYTVYFISGINYKSNNAFKKNTQKKKHRPVDFNGVARCIKIICAIVMRIFIPRREPRSRGNEFPRREIVETIRIMIITTSDSTWCTRVCMYVCARLTNFTTKIDNYLY